MLPEILFGGLAGHQFVGPDGEATSVCAVRRDGPLQDGCSRLVLQNAWLVVANALLDTTLSQLHRPDQP